MIPLAVLSGAFTIMNGTISLGQFAFKLKDVYSDTKTCILLLKRVNKDIAVADELGKLIHSKNIWRSGQFKRVLDVIRDTRGASLELAKLIRVSKVKPMTLKTRFRWVMMDKESFVIREKRLNYCHRSLLQVIGTMEHALAYEPPLIIDNISAKFHHKWQDLNQKDFQLSARTPSDQIQGTETRQYFEMSTLPAPLMWQAPSLSPLEFRPTAPSNERYCGDWQLTCSYYPFDCRGPSAAGLAMLGWLPAGFGCCCSGIEGCCSGS